MEDMEIDQIVEVPDTPDRLTARHLVGQKYVGNPDVFDERYVNEKRERGCPVAENGNNRRPSFRPMKNSHSNEMKSFRYGIEISPSRKSYASRNTPIFRRISTDKISGDETTHSNRAEKMEKEKALRTKFPSKSPCYGDVAAFDLTDDSGQPKELKSAFSYHGLKDNATEDKKEKNTSVGSLPFIPDSSNTSCNAFTGKCKSDNNTVSSANLNVIRGKGIDLSSDCDQKTEKKISFPPRGFTAQRVSGQKRLVRNGCISPYNIASMAKLSAEQNGQGHHNVEQSDAGHAVSSDARTVINVDDIVAEEKVSSRVKGKGVLVHPSSSNAPDSGTMNTTISPVINNKEASGTSHAIRNSLSCIGQPGGWRSTRNHRSLDQPIYDVTRHHSRRNIDAGNYISTRCRNRSNLTDTSGGQSSRDFHSSPEDCAAQETSVSIAEVDQYAGPRPTVSTLPKRQRKHELTSRDPNGYSAEVMFLGSSGESSSNSRSYRSPVLPEVVELSPETIYTNRVSQDLDEMNNDDLDARARQMEADELLARELQEQLYHEDSFEGREIDEHLAWELQHEDEVLHMSIESDQILQPRRISRAPSNRQPPSRSHRNSTNMRRSVAQVPLSNRMSRLRNRFQSRSPTPTISSRGRRLRFPLDMDLDMRLDILEALEDAVGDLSEMGMAGDFFQTQRDFNENDYEMLLALDENNHQHAGASANQINSLPQSTVQTHNFEEACAVCLETPAKGETIRHLPCLHKFHKDCIDPWLQRKTSCPVCKSAVT